MFNPLPKDKILNVTKLKAFADNKSNIAKIANFVFDRVENTLGKGENDGNQNFIFSFIVSFKGVYLDFSHLTELENIYIYH